MKRLWYALCLMLCCSTLTGRQIARQQLAVIPEFARLVSALSNSTTSNDSSLARACTCIKHKVNYLEDMLVFNALREAETLIKSKQTELGTSADLASIIADYDFCCEQLTSGAWLARRPLEPSSDEVFDGSIYVNLFDTHKIFNSGLTFIQGDADRNTTLGTSAGARLDGGVCNTAIGDAALLALTSGVQNTMVGCCAGMNLISGDKNTYVGYGVSADDPAESNVTRIGHPDGVQTFISGIYGATPSLQPPPLPVKVVGIDAAGQLGTQGTMQIPGDLIVVGTLTSGSSSFDITHPDPAKAEQGYRLSHSSVESPTAGDNLYRYQVAVVNGYAELVLPDYFKYLNGNVQAFVSPVDVLGVARAECSDKKVAIYATEDGTYNVLVIGTRIDSMAANSWAKTGVEYIPAA